MKFNKWTLGLAAVGAVSLTSAQAVENNLSPIQSAAQGLIISGYIDTSIEYGLAPGGNDYGDSPMMGIPFRGYDSSKQNGFNLNVIQLNIEKPLDESEYASGGKMSLLFGPDAVGYNSSANSYYGFGGRSNSDFSDFAIKQAYVHLRYPLGNGLEVKLGVYDTIIGYEVFEAGNNPNFTRSHGYAVEPTQHTGVLLAYRFSELINAQLGVANTSYGGINARKGYKYGNIALGATPLLEENDFDDYGCKTILGSVQLTAPDSMGFLAGSSLYAGVVSGWGTVGNTPLDDGLNTLNVYVGTVANTPIADLTTGVAFDYSKVSDSSFTDEHYIVGLYASYKATEKLSLHGRAEYGWWEYDPDGGSSDDGCYWGLTGTIQYDLFANVISRLEIRYEQDDDYSEECGAGLYANLIYKF